MTALFSVIIMCSIVTGLAWAVGSAMPTLLPRSSKRKRVIVSALTGGLTPFLVLAAIVVIAGTGGSDTSIVLVVLIGLGLIASAIVGLPIAMAVTKNQMPPDQSIGNVFD